MSLQLSLTTFQFLWTCKYYITTALTGHIPVPLNLWVLHHHSSYWPTSSSSELVRITSPQISLTTFQFLWTCKYYITTALTDHIPVPLNLWVLCQHSSHWLNSSLSELVSITSPQLSLTTFQFLTTCEYYVTTALTDNIPVPFSLWVLHHHSSYWPHSSSSQLVSIMSPQLSQTTFQFLSTCEYYVTTALTDHIPVPVNLWVLCHHSSHWPHSSSSQLVSITSPQLSLTTFQFLSACEYYITTALTDHIPVPLNLSVLHHNSSHWPHSSSSQLVSTMSPQLSLTGCEYYITTALTDHIPVPLNLWVLHHHSSHWPHSSSSQLVSIMSPQLSLNTFQFLSTCEYYITTALTGHIPVSLNLWVLHHHSSHWPHSSSSQLVSTMSPQLSLATFQFLLTCEYYVTTTLTDHIPVPLHLWVLCHHSSYWPHSSSSQLVSIMSPQLSLATFQFLLICEYYVTTALTDHIPVPLSLWVLCHHSSHWPHSSSSQLVRIMSPTLTGHISVHLSLWVLHHHSCPWPHSSSS